MELLGLLDPAAIGGFTYVNVSTAFHRLAKLASAGGDGSRRRVLSSAAFRALEERLRELPRLPARNAANIMWAFGSLRHCPPPSLWGRLEAAFVDGSARASPQNLSNALWACAVLGVQPSKDLLASAVEVVRATGAEFEARNVSIMVWALAKASGPGGEVDPTVAGILDDLQVQAGAGGLAGFSAQNLANTAWGLGVMGHRLRPELAGALRERLREEGFVERAFSPQNVANLLWGLAKAPGGGEAVGVGLLLGVFADYVERNSTALNAQNVSDLLFAFAALGSEAGALESVRQSSGVHSLASDYRRLRSEMQPGFASDGLEGLALLGLQHVSRPS